MVGMCISYRNVFSSWRQDLCVKSSGKPEPWRFICWREVGNTLVSLSTVNALQSQITAVQNQSVFILESFQSVSSFDHFTVTKNYNLQITLTEYSGFSLWLQLRLFAGQSSYHHGRGGLHIEADSLGKELWKGQKRWEWWRDGRPPKLFVLTRVGLCFAFEAEWGDKSRQAKKGAFRELYTALPGVSLCCTNELPSLNTLLSLLFLSFFPVPVPIPSSAFFFQCMLPLPSFT